MATRPISRKRRRMRWRRGSPARACSSPSVTRGSSTAQGGERVAKHVDEAHAKNDSALVRQLAEATTSRRRDRVGRGGREGHHRRVARRPSRHSRRSRPRTCRPTSRSCSTWRSRCPRRRKTSRRRRARRSTRFARVGRGRGKPWQRRDVVRKMRALAVCSASPSSWRLPARSSQRSRRRADPPSPSVRAV